ncbi:MAG TPA: flagellar motor protein MotB [Thiobacillaceae bacterium]|nr:flagellar motor protein MotB [Thiobacillaceae bacterium]HNA82011.1 flagellar motor protein MotB [Thiobacillaceae bacterium]HNF88817.1 flagellar motor protein MotB [Thiobacillaceae bacterium]HNH88949.1 flagellar motor protein MotB [Thiobacillaceae bacterium]HNI07964.1 flagellar motor protein MotB [Thiobacillaceae bacterium]
MADDTQRPIVIKRIKKGGGGAHGGAWKIAYADFVTAMMAFFLLMWLLGSATKAKLEGIAEYFKTPMKVAMSGGSGAGDATSIIKGGGTDLTKRAGQVKKGEVESSKSRADQEKQESTRLENLKAKLEKAIDSNAKMAQFKKQLKLEITTEGLRIQIVDDKNRPMFDSGGAVMKPYTRDILREIGKTLNEVPNKISLSGHTDAIAYSGGEAGYSNWELSADRANASRRELVTGGLEDGKVLRVVGLASAIPFDKNDPNGPINRRISIIVMNKKAEEAITQEARQVEAGTAKEVAEKLDVKR